MCEPSIIEIFSAPCNNLVAPPGPACCTHLALSAHRTQSEPLHPTQEPWLVWTEQVGLQLMEAVLGTWALFPKLKQFCEQQFGQPFSKDMWTQIGRFVEMVSELVQSPIYCRVARWLPRPHGSHHEAHEAPNVTTPLSAASAPCADNKRSDSRRSEQLRRRFDWGRKCMAVCD